MPLVVLKQVVFKCDAPKCDRTFTYIEENPKTEFPEWWKRVRAVRLFNGEEKTYCDKQCETVAAQAGVNDVPAESKIQVAQPEQIKAVAKDASLAAGLATTAKPVVSAPTLSK